MGRSRRLTPEAREHAVRLAVEQRPAHPSQWVAPQALATQPDIQSRTARRHRTRRAAGPTGLCEAPCDRNCSRSSTVPGLAFGEQHRQRSCGRGEEVTVPAPKFSTGVSMTPHDMPRATMHGPGPSSIMTHMVRALSVTLTVVAGAGLAASQYPRYLVNDPGVWKPWKGVTAIQAPARSRRPHLEAVRAWMK